MNHNFRALRIKMFISQRISQKLINQKKTYTKKLIQKKIRILLNKMLYFLSYVSNYAKKKIRMKKNK